MRTDDDPREGNAGRRTDQRAMNDAFNRFLHIDATDYRLVRRHHEILAAGAEDFAAAFYDYLMAADATRSALQDYVDGGGHLDRLIAAQLAHFAEFLRARIDVHSAERLSRIGAAHYRHGVEPVWIMGGHLLYLNHLRGNLARGVDADALERAQLEAALVKLLFRNMGLMIEGYWEAAAGSLRAAREHNDALQEQIAGLLANIPQLLWSVDVATNRPLYISPGAREVCDIDVELPIPCLAATHAEDRPLVTEAWREALAGREREVESRVSRRDGETVWFRRVFYPYRDAAGRVVRIDGLMEDVTESRRMVAQLQQMATTDSLTGLTNRALLNDRIGQALKTAQRYSDREVVLMLLDLNHFKEINDTLGHDAGDAVLCEVARRLRRVVRKMDTLARLGGDEFAILLPWERDGRAAACKVAENILAAFAGPVDYEGSQLYVSTGIGIALYPEHGDDVATLLKCADVAMYGTKNREVHYAFYDAEQDGNARERLQLSADLRFANERGELVLVYQAKVDMRSTTVIGAEALMRWQHPERGMLPPADFIPLAERSGLIVPLTDWAIETAARQCRAWSDAGLDLSVAVNVPGRALQDRGLAQRVADILERSGLPGRHLELEITEDVLMSDMDNVTLLLGELAQLGVSVAIDDFGTGYSSLAYLRRLPLQTLKIDRSFVMGMDRDDNAAVIVRAIVDLAHNLGLRVVAEGIESGAVWERLDELRCDEGQGFWIGRPVPPDELAACCHRGMGTTGS